MLAILQVVYGIGAGIIFFSLCTALCSAFNYVWGHKASTVMQVWIAGLVGLGCSIWQQR